MQELNNVIAAEMPIIVQRMASFSWSFEFYESEAPDAVPIDPDTLVDVVLTLENCAKKHVLQYRIGQGFTIEVSQETGRKVVVMDKAYTEDNLPAGTYRYDMLVIRNAQDAAIPLKGPFVYEKNISE